MALTLRKPTLYSSLGFVVTLLIIAGCGHGGGGSTHPSLVGTYLGTANTTLSSSRVLAPVNGSIQFVVAADNSVSVGDPGQPPFGQGTLNGNTFTAVAPGSIANSPGISCGGTIVFDGTITGTNMNGTASSNGFACNGVPFTVSGTFTATLQAERPTTFSGRGGIGQTLRDAVRSQ